MGYDGLVWSFHYVKYRFMLLEMSRQVFQGLDSWTSTAARVTVPIRKCLSLTTLHVSSKHSDSERGEDCIRQRRDK